MSRLDRLRNEDIRDRLEQEGVWTWQEGSRKVES